MYACLQIVEKCVKGGKTETASDEKNEGGNIHSSTHISIRIGGKTDDTAVNGKHAHAAGSGAI